MANTLAELQPSKTKSPVVCVFCASSPGKDPIHLKSARELGTTLHEAGYKLIYGGGTMGIMGELASTLVSLSGSSAVHGVIPRALVRTEKDGTLRGDLSPARPAGSKQAERSLSVAQLKRVDSKEDPDSNIIPESEFGKTTIVPDMHTRKKLMADYVDAGGPGSGFVALAGGYGTIEEVMEMVTWNQLGIHKLPIVLVNIDGYWDGLLSWVKNSTRAGFIGETNADILVEVKDPKDVVEALRDYKVAEGRFKLDWTV